VDRFTHFTKHFMRKSDGVWECRHDTELDLPEGRIHVAAGTVFTKGTKFMGVDVVVLLEAEYKQARLRPRL